MIDEIDLKILAALDQNSRVSFSELGKSLKALPETIRYRFQRLVDDGVIRGCATTIDNTRLGFMHVKLFLRLQSCSESQLEQLLTYLRRNKKVMRLTVYEGPFDIGVVLKVNNLNTADLFVTQLLGKFGTIIAGRSLSLNVWGRYLERTYLSNKRLRSAPRSTYGERRGEIYQLRPEEREILRQISSNSRISGIALERSLRAKSEDYWMGSDTILNRIRRFEKEKIITGYIVALDIEKLGRFGLKVLIELQPKSDETIYKLIQSCEEFPEITHIVKSLGQWDLELDFEAGGHQDCRRIMMTLGSRYPGLIRETITLRYLSVEKFSFYSGEASDVASAPKAAAKTN